jgi:UDP-N-acetyl-D-glucosamine dehydrogenase
MTEEELRGADCVVIVTDHTGVDYEKVVRMAALIIDTRNVTRKLNLAEHESKVIRL